MIGRKGGVLGWDGDVVVVVVGVEGKGGGGGGGGGESCLGRQAV